jgi:hypothetical protein
LFDTALQAGRQTFGPRRQPWDYDLFFKKAP